MMDAKSEEQSRPHEAEDTRERILAASRSLFADRGFDATSVRDITTVAGCNVASVNYHFGGKENLYLETFRSMLAEIRDRRLAMLDELLGRAPLPSLEEFLGSFALGFLDPFTDKSQGRLFMALVSREMLDPRLPHEVFLCEFVHPVLERATVALATFGPALDPHVARLCVMTMVGQLLHALKALHLFSESDRHQGLPHHFADYVPHFVRFAAGGIRACAANDRANPADSPVSEVTA